MKRKTKLCKSKKKRSKASPQEMIVDMNQSFSGQDEFAFELADSDDDAGFYFEADFEADER